LVLLLVLLRRHKPRAFLGNMIMLMALRRAVHRPWLLNLLERHLLLLLLLLLLWPAPLAPSWAVSCVTHPTP
jgi:hypothetical protein